jgi:hypothetical protein
MPPNNQFHRSRESGAALAFTAPVNWGVGRNRRDCFNAYNLDVLWNSYPNVFLRYG